MSHFCDRLDAAIHRCQSPALVGIDPTLEKLPVDLRPVGSPPRVRDAVAAIEAFSECVIDLVAPLVPAVKINSGFFEALYSDGVAAYFRLVARAHRAGLLVIGDIKRGDIGSTAELYARGHIAHPAFADVDPDFIPDAVTLAAYLGVNAVRPFIEHARRTGRGVYILVRPSDPGADAVHEFAGDSHSDNNTINLAGENRSTLRFYQHMADLVRTLGIGNDLIGQCGLSLVGAVVAPKDLNSTRALRQSMPATPFLVPGYGAQGATASQCAPCFLPDGRGAIINASRSVIHAFENPTYQRRFGVNWRACIEQACRDFVSDLRSITIPPAD